MKASYDKNECGYKCMVEEVKTTGRGIVAGSQLYRGVSFDRHPTKKLAKDDAISRMEKVMF